ncbi:hypothetical protein CLOSYM_03742 [[Clostridium] symbiosum ATCC 14940]|uniref:Uncharacterized protein n=1 Tax=[Clostridium] symbiosum ATCC 14940 TaxID=411472 RepID=A0ABC9TTR0_CLOSY|nr:hypothetical protein CLOSYM_03742 [[Clostridium] symbiosum ATCC 14940]
MQSFAIFITNNSKINHLKLHLISFITFLLSFPVICCNIK